jgi:hypothetical protein
MEPVWRRGREGPDGERRRLEVVVDFVNFVLSSERLLLLPCRLLTMDSLLLRRGEEKELPLVPLWMESCWMN